MVNISLYLILNQYLLNIYLVIKDVIVEANTTTQNSISPTIIPSEHIKSVLISTEESLSPIVLTSSEEIIRRKNEIAVEKKRDYRNRLDEEQRVIVRLKDAERKALQREEAKKSNTTFIAYLTANGPVLLLSFCLLYLELFTKINYLIFCKQTMSRHTVKPFWALFKNIFS